MANWTPKMIGGRQKFKAVTLALGADVHDFLAGCAQASGRTVEEEAESVLVEVMRDTQALEGRA